MKKLLIILFMASAFVGQSQVNKLLIARNTGQYPIWNGDTIHVFGFAQKLKEEVKIPGPTLIFNEGDSVNIDLWNVSQGAPHTIHLHGLDVDQANDGVPHLSFDVGHMKHGYYHFKAPHAGTYLYHCHVVSTIHVQAGMYGLIIIRPPNGSFTTWDGGFAYDKEISWMTSELDTNWHKDDVLDHDHDTNMTIMRVEIPEFHPQHFLVNGLSEHQLSDSLVALHSAVGENLYLRLANIGFHGNTIKFPSGYNVRIISSDGRPLPSEELSDSITIFPGERYSIMLNATSEFTDSVSVTYFDLNTNIDVSTQWVSATSDGFISIEEIQKEELRIYPNPTEDIVYFEIDNFKPLQWNVVDVMGREWKIDVTELTEGLYHAQIAHLPSGWYNIQALGLKGVIGSTLIKQ